MTLISRNGTRVQALADIASECRTRVRRCGSGGYEALSSNGQFVRCTGLVNRLQSKIMPDLPPLPSMVARNAPWFLKKSRGGSSASLGKRIDWEVRHLLQCVRDVDVQRIATSGEPFPRIKGPCPSCGLTGSGYNRRTPMFHKWTRAYLADAHRLGMRLYAAQIPVALRASRLGTEIDELATDVEGVVYAIERKTGYQDATGKPRTRNPTPIRILDPQGSTVVAELPNTYHTLHRLQGAVGGLMLAETLRGMPIAPVKIRTCVVYVSGKSRAPSSQGRDHDSSLQCVWLWSTPQLESAAARVLHLI